MKLKFWFVMTQTSAFGFLSEGFELRSAAELSEDQTPVSQIGPALYAFMIRGGDQLLDASGYFDLGGKPPTSVEGYCHLYTGYTHQLSTRLKRHLKGDVRTSTLRKSLLSIDVLCVPKEKSILNSATPFNEEPLNQWLATNAVVAVRRAECPELAEKDLLLRTASPLNITERKVQKYARRLIGLRCIVDGKPVPISCRPFLPNFITHGGTYA
jgi:hypothetical protein